MLIVSSTLNNTSKNQLIMNNLKKIQSTFRFPVKVAGEIIAASSNPWLIGTPLPKPKENVVYLVNARVFAENPNRKDLCMLNPENVQRNDKGHAIEYASLIYSS